MDKVAMYKEYIEKKASIEAIRKKQYWQMLKRLHGGGDEAVKKLSKTRDFGIYHSTDHAERVLSQGADAAKNKTGVFGKGTYFASVGDEGFGEHTIRFKKPSELRDTKMAYPDVSKIKNHEVKANPRTMDPILRKSQSYGSEGVNNTLFDNGKSIDEIRDIIAQKHRENKYAKRKLKYQENSRIKTRDKGVSSTPPRQSQFLVKGGINPNILTEDTGQFKNLKIDDSAFTKNSNNFKKER
jgi:hypothetical protein